MVVIGECLIVNHNTKYNLCSWGLEFDQFCIGNEGWMVVVDAWRELIWPFQIVMYGKVVGGCLWILIVGDYKKFVLYKWVTLGTYHSSNNVWLTKAFLVSLAPIFFSPVKELRVWWDILNLMVIDWTCWKVQIKSNFPFFSEHMIAVVI